MSSKPSTSTAAVGENGAVPSASVPIAPLTVSGLVVSRQELVRALRAAYVPQLADMQEIVGDRFVLVLAEGAQVRS